MKKSELIKLIKPAKWHHGTYGHIFIDDDRFSICIKEYNISSYKVKIKTNLDSYYADESLSRSYKSLKNAKKYAENYRNKCLLEYFNLED